MKKKRKVFREMCRHCGETYETTSMRGAWFCSPACMGAYAVEFAPPKPAEKLSRKAVHHESHQP